jgi:hypothetical protein
MFRTASFVCLVAVVTLGCDSKKDASGTAPRASQAERTRVRSTAPAPAPALPAPPVPAPAPPAAAPGETTRLTSEGERIRVEIPPPDPVLEVPEGSRCGVLNKRGELLSCQAGTVCVSSSNVEGAPATCQPAPRAPRWEG